MVKPYIWSNLISFTMKKSLLIFTIFIAFCSGINAQAPASSSKVEPFRVSTHSGYVFSFGQFERNNNLLKNPVRFTVVINLGIDAVWQKEHVGLSIGLETRNLGTITEDTLNKYDNVRVKSRVYTFGVPVSIMIGNLAKKTYFYAGGEYEYTFDYKEKVFVDGDKQYKSKGKYTYNVNRWLASVHAGIQIKSGTYLKFQYYVTPFFHDKYQFTYTQGTTQVYAPYNKSQLYFVEIGHRAYLDQKPKAAPNSQQTRANLRRQMAAM
jgi:hypothetical protein